QMHDVNTCSELSGQADHQTDCSSFGFWRTRCKIGCVFFPIHGCRQYRSGFDWARQLRMNEQWKLCSGNMRQCRSQLHFVDHRETFAPRIDEKTLVAWNSFGREWLD